MKRYLPLTAVLLAGCNSPVVVRTGLTARPSPIEAKGAKIEAKILPTAPGATRMARVTATAPARWTGPFELALSSEEDPVGSSGTSSISTGSTQLETSVSPAFEKGDDRIFGRVTAFATADETIVLSKASVIEEAPGRFFLKLDAPQTLVTPSGFVVTFPKQTSRLNGSITGSPTDPTLRLLCRMSRRGKVAALGARVPADFESEKVSSFLYDLKGAVRWTSIPVEESDRPVDHDLQFDYPAKKVGTVGPLKFKVRHRADLEVIPFSVIAVP